MSVTPSPAEGGAPELSLVLIQLFRGPLYQDSHDKLWPLLVKLRAAVSDHVAMLGLRVDIDESEGYAFLRSQPDDEDAPTPRLVHRRTLSFHVSVLLALLRKRLAESDASSADPRLVLSRDQIVEMLRLFLPQSSNDARLVDSVDAHINKVVELGFLHRLRNEPDRFEVRRILRAFVDAQWLHDFDERLAEYMVELGDASEPG